MPCLAVAIGLEQAAPVLVAQGQHLTYTSRLAIEPNLLEEDLETIAFPEVSMKVEVPLQNVGHASREERRAGRLDQGVLKGVFEYPTHSTYDGRNLEGPEVR